MYLLYLHMVAPVLQLHRLGSPLMLLLLLLLLQGIQLLLP